MPRSGCRRPRVLLGFPVASPSQCSPSDPVRRYAKHQADTHREHHLTSVATRGATYEDRNDNADDDTRFLFTRKPALCSALGHPESAASVVGGCGRVTIRRASLAGEDLYARSQRQMLSAAVLLSSSSSSSGEAPTRLPASHDQRQMSASCRPVGGPDWLRGVGWAAVVGRPLRGDLASARRARRGARGDFCTDRERRHPELAGTDSLVLPKRW